MNTNKNICLNNYIYSLRDYSACIGNNNITFDIDVNLSCVNLSCVNLSCVNLSCVNLSCDNLLCNNKDLYTKMYIRLYFISLPSNKLIVEFCDYMFQFLRNSLYHIRYPIISEIYSFEEINSFYHFKHKDYDIDFFNVKQFNLKEIDNKEIDEEYILHNSNGPAIELFDKKMKSLYKYYYFNGRYIPKNIPKIDDKINNKDIIDVIVNFDREYGSYLFSINKG